jgi:hypothetical protein
MPLLFVMQKGWIIVDPFYDPQSITLLAGKMTFFIIFRTATLVFGPNLQHGFMASLHSADHKIS